MLTDAYFQIWRPCADGTSAYCTASNFSKGFFELCGGYAEAENGLRAVLNHAQLKDLDRMDPRIYSRLKLAAFELQEQYRMILAANGFKAPRSVPAEDFSILEPAMRLSGYRAVLLFHGEEIILTPFESLPGGLDLWYLGGISPFSFKRPGLEHATLRNLLLAVAALRCLLYAQFGPQSGQAITPTRKKISEDDSRLTSIFTVTPPDWEDAQWYQITYEPPRLKAVRPYPFFD